jgi:hypothetical protein
MKSTLKVLLIGTWLSVLGVAASAAAATPATDPAIGTWTLTLAKSTFDLGPAPKRQVRTYVASGNGLLMTVKTVSADGTQSTQTATFAVDGKDYPISGSAAVDTVSCQSVDANHGEYVVKKNGAAVGSGTWAFSKNHKMLTLRDQGTGADGKTHENVAVYRRS